MIRQKIAIIGNGNMGQAIVQGLLNKEIITQNQLLLANSQTRNNKEVAEKADIIILAVKPQIAHVILEEIKDVITDQLIISIMAGVTIDAIQRILERKVAVVRVMPNLAAKIGQSMSVWVESKGVTENQEVDVRTILEAVGLQLELQEEKQIDMATAISGSGPAYFFYFAELLERGAIELGFSQKKASLLVRQTLLGSAQLLQESTYSAEKLRGAVTSKGGTTETAFIEFKKENLEKIFKKGIFAAFDCAQKLKIS